MKRWFLIFALLVGASFAQQLQQNFPVGTIPFAGVPSGSCGPAQNAVNTVTGVYYFCNGGVWTAIANNTFPTANTVTESTNTVTATTVSGNWPAAYQPGASISETGCSVGGYNITAAIISGGGGGTTLTFTDPTGSLGAGSGCTANLASSSGGTITGVTAGAGLSGGGTTGGVTLSIPALGVSNGMLLNSALTLNCPSMFTCGTGSLGSSITLGFAGAQSANSFLATPNGSSGALGLRVIASGDIPASIAANTSGTAANLSGTPTLPAVTFGGGATVPNAQTLTIASGGTLNCAGGSTCPGGSVGGLAGGTQGGTVVNNSSSVSSSSLRTLDLSAFPGTGSGSICDRLAQAFPVAVAANVSTIDARAIQGATTCSPAESAATFPYTGNPSQPAMQGMDILLGAVTIKLGASTTLLGLPAWTIPSTVRIAGISTNATQIVADNTGCSSITPANSTSCTNFGVRSYTPSAGTPPAISGTTTNTGRFVQFTVATTNSNAAISVCASWISQISRSAGGEVTVNCAHGMPPVISAGHDVVIAGVVGCTTSPNGTFTIDSVADATHFTFPQAGTVEACGGTTGTAAVKPYPTPIPGEPVQAQTTTGAAANNGDNNWGMFRVCGLGNPGTRGNCPNNPTNALISWFSKPENGSVPVATTNGGQIFLSTPLIAFGLGNIAQNQYQINGRRVALENMVVNCASVPGCIAVENVATQELTHVNFVSMQNAPFIAYAKWNGGSSGEGNSGPDLGNYVTWGTGSCNYGTVGVWFQDQYTRDYEGLTNNADTCNFNNTFNNAPASNTCNNAITANNCPGPSYITTPHPRFAIVLDGPSFSNKLTQWHVEGYNTAMELGFNQVIGGIRIDGMHAQQNVINCIEVSDNFGAVASPTSDIVIFSTNKGAGGGCTFNIVDNNPHHGVTYNDMGDTSTSGSNGINAMFAWDVTSTGSLDLFTTDADWPEIFDSGIIAQPAAPTTARAGNSVPNTGVQYGMMAITSQTGGAASPASTGSGFASGFFNIGSAAGSAGGSTSGNGGASGSWTRFTGNGGAATSGVAGNAGNILDTCGNGGAAAAGTNGNGCNIILTPGLAGAGAGAAGVNGQVQIPQGQLQIAPGLNAATSPSIVSTAQTDTGMNIGGAQFSWDIHGGGTPFAVSAASASVGSAKSFCWSSTAVATGGCDSFMSRGAANVYDFGSAAATTDGTIKAADYQSVGTKFTSNAGCTESALVGGATAGKFTVGQATACTIIITMGNTATSANGWACYAYDQTAVPAVAIRQTASNTTTASLLMTVATNDVVTFGCIGY